MGRTVSISCLRFEVPPIPACFIKTAHMCQEVAIAPLSFHLQAISNTHTYTGSQQTQYIHGRCTCIQFVGIDRSNSLSDFGLHEIKIVAAPPQMLCSKPVTTIEFISTTPYIHSMDPRHKPSIWCSEQVKNPPRATLGHLHLFRLSTGSRTFCPWGT